MIKPVYLLTLFLVILMSCKKNKTTTQDNNCIYRTRVNQSSYTISADEYATTVSLFKQNNLRYDNLRWYYFDLSSSVLSGTKEYYHYIRADQYLNGLRIFNGGVVHHFRDGQFFQLSGYEIPSTSLDTTANLELTQLRKLFVDKLLNTPSSNDLKKYSNDCMVSEFCYYDLNQGAYGNPVNLIKLWRVYPQTNEKVFGYFNDDGTLIAFSDGVIGGL